MSKEVIKMLETSRSINYRGGRGDLSRMFTKKKKFYIMMQTLNKMR